MSIATRSAGAHYLSASLACVLVTIALILELWSALEELEDERIWLAPHATEEMCTLKIKQWLLGKQGGVGRNISFCHRMTKLQDLRTAH